MRLKLIQNILSLFFILFILPSLTWAQCNTLRYKKEIFSSVTVHHDVKYGEADRWNIPYNSEDLKMDIYIPDGDTLTHRPLMIWAHPGGFINGSKSADAMVAFCDSFAKRGYVTASIDYRLGFNPASETSAERAGYRAVQDMRAAVRFLKENYMQYGIDTNYTFIGGSSAGALMVDQLVYLDQNEAPSSISAGPGFPALGCLDCTGNTFHHAMDIKAYVSLWGALEDSTWIQANETTPGLLVHGKADGTVPFAIGHPFGVPTMPETEGSRCISNQLTSLGIPHETYFVAGVGHEFYGADNGDFNSPPNAYWDTIFTKIQTLFYRQLPKDTLSIVGQPNSCTFDTVTYHVPVPNGYHLCWSVNNGTILNTSGNSAQILFNQSGPAIISVHQFSRIMVYNGTTTFNVTIAPKPTVNFLENKSGLSVQFTPLPSGFVNYIWDFGDGSGSSSLSPTHLYATLGSYPVSLTVIDQNGCKAKHTKTIDLNSASVANEAENYLKIYPNPATNQLIISNGNQIKWVIFYTETGKKVEKLLINEKKTKISLLKFTAGNYLVKIIGTNGKVIKSKINIH